MGVKLPSGYEIDRDKLIEIFEDVVAEKFMMEETFAVAFESTADALGDGNFADMPALGMEDINFIYMILANLVIECETKLRNTLVRFEAENPAISSW